MDRKSPTTARSIVNRVWQAYFGTGIVATAENFGTQCEPPSNPELLDWLAVEFMDSGWSLKKLHRLIVTSATYRQSSKVTPELLAKDPDNRLLARGPRLRVDAETVRDIALAASGLLNPADRRPQRIPARAGLPLPAAGQLFAEDRGSPPKGADKYRRGALHVPLPQRSLSRCCRPSMRPTARCRCVRRTRSNTPLQALTTLNEPLFVESAQALARRVLKEGGANDRERMNYAFRLATARTPSPAEADVLLGLLAKEEKRIADGWVSAQEIAGQGARRGEVAPTRVAAWTVVARVMLNLDETITKE